MHISWKRTDQHWIAEIIYAGGVDCHSSLEYEFIRSSSSRKIHRSGLCRLGADEKPEEVAGSCDVIGSVISECKLRLM
jgi:hypothetical protein